MRCTIGRVHDKSRCQSADKLLYWSKLEETNALFDRELALGIQCHFGIQRRRVAKNDRAETEFRDRRDGPPRARESGVCITRAGERRAFAIRVRSHPA